MPPVHANFRRVLLVEWGGLAWPDLLPRLRAGHFPALQAATAAGVFADFAPCAPDAWPLGRALGWLAEAGVGVLAPDAAALPPEARVTEADLASELLGQFPPDAEARPALVAALCELYALHNETVIRLGEPAHRLVVNRHDFAARIDAAYARSPALPHARRMALQLLDLLLADLRREAGEGVAVLVCSPGAPARRGFCLHAVPGSPASALPRLPGAEMLPALLAALLGLRVADGSPLAAPAPLDAAWLRPSIPPAGRHASDNIAPAPAAALACRETAPADYPRLAALFPGIAWETATACHLAVASSAAPVGAILAAAALQSYGGVLLAARPGQAAAAEAALARLLADARVRALPALHNASEAPSGSLLAAAFLAAGFTAAHTLDLWLTEVSAMRERLRAMHWTRDAAWRLHPATAADLAHWLARPETASLLRPDTGFDPDLSWALWLDARPAGLLLVERLATGPACANLIAVAEEARSAGGFSLLFSQVTAALHLAGIAQVVFSTDQTRREMIAFARRCRSRLLRQTLRLHLPQAEALKC